MRILKRFCKQWSILIICGHCGYKIRNWNTKGLAGLLAPLLYPDICPNCKHIEQWWINVEPLENK